MNARRAAQPETTSIADGTLPRLCSLIGLEGKRAVVSGGASGIGFAVSTLLAEIGMQVEILDINVPDFRDRPNLAPNITSHRLDVTQLQDCRAIADELAASGRLRTLVNAAGIVIPDSEEGPSGVLPGVLACNVLGTAHLCEAFAPYFEESGGTIVNIGSVVGTLGWPKRAAYCASKGAVEAMSRALALEYAAKNIRVNVVAPGIVATPLMKEIVMRQEHPYQAYQQRACQQINGRMLLAEEVARAVLYLASDLSCGVVGATLDVSVGRVAGHLPPPALHPECEARQDAEWLRFAASL